MRIACGWYDINPQMLNYVLTEVLTFRRLNDKALPVERETRLISFAWTFGICLFACLYDSRLTGWKIKHDNFECTKRFL